MWAQVVVRRFAAATNLLVPGQAFLITAPEKVQGSSASYIRALTELLGDMGAFPRVLPTGAAVPEDARVLIHVLARTPETSTAKTPPLCPVPRGVPRAELLHVHAPVACAALTQVLDGDGTPVLAPHDPRVGADPGRGAARIEWARRHMPVTRAAVERLAQSGGLTGRRVGLSLVLEPKTAVLALELARAGAEVSVFGHAQETRTDVAAALRQAGLAVFADADADSAEEALLADRFLSQELDLLLDDGSHLIRRAHDTARFTVATPGGPTTVDPLSRMVGAAEETTSGLRPLRQWAKAGPGEGSGHLRIPVIASNDARSKTLFDNAYGTGQSCLMTILDLLDPTGNGLVPPAEPVVVVGYGDVGRGFARLARAVGLGVQVAEVDPVRGLQARMDGFATGALVDLSRHAWMVVSATGVPHTITARVLTALREGSVVAVAGGVENEVALDEALARGATWSPVSRGVEDLHLASGTTVRVLDRGACINCTAGEGNPIEIMDLSFAVQVAALDLLVSSGQGLAPGLYPLPREQDDAVAAAALLAWPPVSAAPSSPDGGEHDE